MQITQPIRFVFATHRNIFANPSLGVLQVNASSDVKVVSVWK